MKETLHLFKQDFKYQNHNDLPKPTAKYPNLSSSLYTLAYVATVELEKAERETVIFSAESPFKKILTP